MGNLRLAALFLASRFPAVYFQYIYKTFIPRKLFRMATVPLWTVEINKEFPEQLILSSYIAPASATVHYVLALYLLAMFGRLL